MKTKQSVLIREGISIAEKPMVYGMEVGSIGSSFHYAPARTRLVDLTDQLESDPEILALGVVDETGKTLGIVTRKDVMGALSRPFGRDVLRKKDLNFLITEPPRFHFTENIFTVAEQLEETLQTNESGFFLLVDERGFFRGLFSGKDMLVFLANITSQDIALSRKVQTRIVKEIDDLSGPHFSLSARSIMAKGIGGDFYTYKMVSPSTYLIALCDVSGKGMAASLLSSLLSGFISTHPGRTDLKSLIKDLNDQLTRSFEGEKFVTGIFLLFDGHTGRAELADMGHRHLILYRKGKQKKIARQISNMPLGVTTELSIKTFSLSLKEQDCLFVMTDGMIEQKNSLGKTYPAERLDALLGLHETASTQDLRARINEDFDVFRGRTAQQDDVSYLILKYTPSETERQSQTVKEALSPTVEDKIRWALNSGKPIQIRTTRYLTHDRQFIDSVLNRFLNEAGVTFLMNKLSYCVHELATNAKKANTKRVYFLENGLDITDGPSYQAGMTDFKRSTLENIDYYLDRQKKMGYYIVVLFHLTEKRLRLSVINNTEMREEEKIRVNQKLELARKADSIRDIYDQVEDYSEGAGLGIVMMSQMLRSMGFGPHSLSIESAQGLTAATITIQLRE